MKQVNPYGSCLQGHTKVDGNEVTDDLAQKGGDMPFLVPEPKHANKME